MWSVIFVGIATPIFATILALSKSVEINPGIIISYIIFWGVSIYFFRLYSWNSTGMVIVTKERNKHKILSKSNYFKFSEKILDSKNLYFSVIPTKQRILKQEKVQLGTLIARSDSEKINLKLELPQGDLVKLLALLNKHNEQESNPT